MNGTVQEESNGILPFGVGKVMVLGTIAILALGGQSAYLRVTAPPDTKAEYRTTLRMDAAEDGELEAFIFSGIRVISNVKTQFRSRQFVSSSKVTASGMFRLQSHQMRDLVGKTFEMNRTARNETISVWNEGKKVALTLTEGFTDLIFPEQPLAIGSTWSQDQSLSGQWVKVDYSLVGFGNSNISRTALIEGRIAEGQGLVSVAPNQYVVDVSTGLIRRASGRYKFEMGGVEVVTTFEVQRSSLVVPPPKVVKVAKSPVTTVKKSTKPASKPRKRPKGG